MRRKGANRNDYDITEAVQCFPGRNSKGRDKKPSTISVRCCMRHLVNDLSQKKYTQMGYDEDYHKNTDYSYVAFFEDDPYKTLQLDGVGLIDINAKETFVKTMMQQVIVWQSIILLGVAGITLLYAMAHWKYQKRYYERLILLGFPTYKRKQHILLDMILPGVAGLVIALLFSTALHTLRNMFMSYTTSIISISFGCLILLITSLIITFNGRKI